MLYQREQQIAAIKQAIEEEVAHDYLNQFIDAPYIDEDRILLLISSLAGQPYTEHEVKQFVATAMLIQIALDTHEKVTNANENQKSRQLTVLAGDYFSSLYYKLLAGVHNVRLVGILAEGIKSVNEYKVMLYQFDNSDAETFVGHLKKTESAIITKFMQFFGSQPLIRLSEELLLFNRLLREKEQAESGKRSILFEALNKMAYPGDGRPFEQLPHEKKRKLFYICEKYLKESIRALQAAAMSCGNEMLSERIRLLMGRYGDATRLYAEEG
ncbi:heptaprenyl diphosphate synthase component 1 [Bacillus coagulans]|uniref:Heptaprenyl diphosphate synthase component I n=1 Tax=Heyndrickxia coagulans TaxID=1398 RepID=A0A150KGZ4_HEYCO|nr:heptaprenyl diphosphate synthase component 1 [Heyndrickxia coagulans]KYC71738.1 Heptaprenyl diphosphate synthase component I [Heyndrickxia coagulans]NCG67995.1 heptaprenyl diphosphate synthase component 1 [Heyndrickxia coagulans]